MHTKLWRKARLPALCIFAALLVSIACSLRFFGIWNPFACGYGLLSLWSGQDVVRIRRSPPYYLARADGAEQHMLVLLEAQGYTYLPEERMGSIRVFEKNGQKQLVVASDNGLFVRWRFD